MKKYTFFALMIFLCLIPVEARAYRVGNMDIALTGGVSGVYDDNITYSSINRIHDFITRPWAGLKAAYEGKTTSLSADGRYYREFYADNPGFDNNSVYFDAALDSELSKFDRIKVSGTFSRAYEPRSFEDVFGFAGGRYTSDRSRANLGYARDISEHFGISLRYSNEYNSYSRSDIPKSYLNTAGLEGAYAVSSDMSLFAAYDFAARDFDPGSDTRIHTLSGGLRKYFTKQLYLDGSGGVDFINSFSGTKFTKPYTAVSLTDDISDRTSAALSFSRRFDTVSYSQDLFDQWRVSLTLLHRILERLGSSISAFYGRGEYIGASRVNKLLGSSAGLTYDINDDWKANVSYSFSRQTSTSPLGGYSKNRVTAGLTAEF